MKKPYMQYMLNSKPIISVFKHDDETFSFSIPVPLSVNPNGIYQEFNFKTPMKALTASESAYDRFNGMPKAGGWK